MSILHWADYRSPRKYFDNETNPYAMPVIVRVEKDGSAPCHEEVLIAVGRAVGLFFDDARNAPGGWWREQTLTWLEGRIRKVVRRARGNEWLQLLQTEHVYSSYGKAEIVILPPHPVDNVPPMVKKLQVSGLDLPKNDTIAGALAGLQVSINDKLGMTTGKAAAQIGHAVQIAIFHSDRDVLISWRDNNFPVGLCSWEMYEDRWSSVIHDAGFTEIPSGSLTSKARLWY